MENTNLKGSIYDLEKLLAIQENKLHIIDGETYSEKELERIPKLSESYRPSNVTVNSLSALCAMLKQEITRLTAPVFIDVTDQRNVQAFTTYREDFKRDRLYCAVCDTPTFDWRNYLDHESAIIAIQSRFIQNEGTKYILELLSTITVDNSVSSNDNGVTQQVEIKKGVSLKQKAIVKPFVSLAPYRTFLEVAQPISTMLLRVNDNAEILLIEADGSMWKLEAKANIKSYLEKELFDLIATGKVIVMS